MTTDTLTRDHLKERSGGVWDYVSPSRLTLWLKCPLAFRLKYIDRVPTPMAPAAFVGRRVHEALETYYRHRQLGLAIDADQLVERLRIAWPESIESDGVKFESSADEQFHWQQTAGLVRTYLAEVAADEPRPLAVETAAHAPLVDPRTGEDLGIPLVGIIDLILPEANSAVITDFKTAARGGDVVETLHEIQLTSYAWLYRHVARQEEAGLEIRSLIKTKTPRVESHRFAARTDAHFRRLFAVIRAYLDDLQTSRFVFRPGLNCLSCELRETHCRAWTG
jgi:hypothetical protein